MLKQTKQKGFTLIELIIVIVILGILAAFILPRFSNISSQARQSTVNAMAGSLKAATAITHGQFLISGLTGSSIQLEDGTMVAMSNGYPQATTSGIVSALQGQLSGSTIDSYNISSGTGTISFSPIGAISSATCVATYTAATAGTGATTTVTASGC